MSASLAVVVLAAGRGTRMKSDRPKVLFSLAGRPMVHLVLDAARALRPARLVVVVGHRADEVRAACRAPDVVFAKQASPRGTGDAVRAALPALRGFQGTVVVLSGDVPLIAPETLRNLVAAHRAQRAAATLLSFRPANPTGYGRIERDAAGTFLDIVEERDATPEQRVIAEVNSGVYAFDAATLPGALRRLRTQNAQGELYLTDVPRILRRDGKHVVALRVLEAEVVAGVNNLTELAAAAAAVRRRTLDALMEQGVEIVDPATTFVAPGSRIGAGTRLEPFTVVSEGVRVGRNCSVGPFAHLRPGTVLDDGASVGNFVEVKNSRLGRGSKARHLAYLGDADVGAAANIGAGTITCNYDGKRKHPTRIGARAFVGSGTLLVAPVSIGAGAVTGAGAVVLAGRDVPAGVTVAGVPARVLPRSGARRTGRRAKSGGGAR